MSLIVTSPVLVAAADGQAVGPPGLGGPVWMTRNAAVLHSSAARVRCPIAT